MKTVYTSENVQGKDSFKVGTSPAGVEWVAYRKSWMNDVAFAKIATRMRERLDETIERHQSARVRVRLTPAQVGAVEDVWGSDFEVHDLYPEEDLRGVELGRNWIEGTRAQLATIGSGVDESTNDAEGIAWSVNVDDWEGSDAQRAARIRFGSMAIVRCRERVASILRAA